MLLPFSNEQGLLVCNTFVNLVAMEAFLKFTVHGAVDIIS